MIKTAIARKLNLLIKPIPSGNASNLFAAEGSLLTIDGVVDIVFNVNGLLIPHTVYVVNNIAETLILGSDFLSENQLVIDYANKVVSLCSDLVRAPLSVLSERQNTSRLSKTVCIPPGSEQIANIICSPRFSNCDVLVEAIPASQFSNDFAVARSICRTDEQAHTVARILNCLPHTLVLSKGTKIAYVNNINVSRDCLPFKTPPQHNETDSSDAKPNISLPQLEQFAAEYGFKINSDLSKSQRLDLLTLLYKYKTCFARTLQETRRYQNYELELTLTDNKPSFRRQYKLSQADAQECHRQIDQMKECNIIEPSQNSAYNSAMFTVRN